VSFFLVLSSVVAVAINHSQSQSKRTATTKAKSNRWNRQKSRLVFTKLHEQNGEVTSQLVRSTRSNKPKKKKEYKTRLKL